MKAVRIGAVGAGNVGADHVHTLHRWVSGAEVTHVADLDGERAAAVAATVPGARSTADAYALIADPEVDAVVIASHDTTHADLAVAAVRAGKPVLCEKPLAPSSASPGRPSTTSTPCPACSTPRSPRSVGTHRARPRR